MKRALIQIVFSCIVLSALPAGAEERILRFHSDITVQKDATVAITETIHVKTEAKEIRRGIYRDFPTRYKDRLGNAYTVTFDLLSVLRDGGPEPYHTEHISNGIRVYIGKEDVFIPPGEYTYTISYTTDRQIGYFPDYDELYWNVTGNGWIFSITGASATVTLPEGATILQHAGYTGPAGSSETGYQSAVEAPGKISFSATRPLMPAEGLTIAVAWPKGIVREPGIAEKTGHMLYDNRGAISGILGFILVLGYYYATWLRFGRDPEPGIIMPRYTPPDNMSPASMRYIRDMGYDERVFASSIINMAVKGAVTISDNDGEYTIRKTDRARSALMPEERGIFEKLLGSVRSITLRQENHAVIRKAIQSVRDYLKLNFEKTYFITNLRFFVIGLVISAAVIALTGFWTALSVGDLPLFGFMSLWLSFWSLGVFLLVSQVVARWRNAFSSSRKRFVNTAGALYLSLFTLPFIGGEIVGIFFMGKATSFFMIPFFLGMAGTNILFYHLLKTPTLAGRKMLDAIEGFRVYLSATEKDRMNMMNPPEKTPELFERYLPYALALGVEQEWSEQFSDILAKAATEPAGYSPVWYSGSSWRSLGASDFASSLGSSFAGAISSSSTAPGSSSGSGGGGSSGGGGGGGGGGGW